jgi:hypothetical protein
MTNGVRTVSLDGDDISFSLSTVTYQHPPDHAYEQDVGESKYPVHCSSV